MYKRQADIDVDDILSISGTYPDWLTLIDSADGTAGLSGMPTNDDVGDHSVVLVVTDNSGATDEQSFMINVSNTNDAPFFTSTPTTSAIEDSEYSYTATASDIDIGDILSISGTYPDWLTLLDNGDGTAGLSGTPTNDDVGDHSVVVTVIDGYMTCLLYTYPSRRD